jgi:hypothetical protein
VNTLRIGGKGILLSAQLLARRLISVSPAKAIYEIIGTGGVNVVMVAPGVIVVSPALI